MNDYINSMTKATYTSQSFALVFTLPQREESSKIVISNARLWAWNIPLMFQCSFSLWHLPCLCVYLETWLVLKEQKLFYLLEQLSKPPKSNQIRSGSSCQQCNASQHKNATVQIGVHAIWTPAGQSSPSWQSYLVVFKEMD